MRYTQSNRINLRKNTRAMDSNQMFIYITAVVVVGFVMIFGFRAVATLISGQEDVEHFRAANAFTAEIDKTRASPNSQNFYTYRIPSSALHLCLINLGVIESGEGNSECPSGLNEISPSICARWADMVDAERDEDLDAEQFNVFHVSQTGSIMHEYFVQNMRVANVDTNLRLDDIAFYCTMQSRIELGLNGVPRSGRTLAYVFEAPR